MALALALIVMGVLIFLDRAGAGYGLREGWPWMVIALGIGGTRTKPQKRPRMGHNDHRGLHSGREILFDQDFNPGNHQDLFSPHPSHCDRPPLAFEVS